MSKIENRIKELTDHTFGTWVRQKAWSLPKMIVDAQGVYMYDDQGKSYLDFTSQLMCSNLGHKNKVVIEAIIKQAEKMPYIAPGFVTETSIQAVKALQTVMPKGLSKFFFSSSGAAANEAALKFIRQSMSPAYKIVSRYHSYHGATVGAMSFTGDPRRWPSEQARCTVQGVRFAPDCYCYRCPFDKTYPECNIQCAQYLDYMFKEEGNVAAFIVEPVVGTNGRIVPPPEYFPLVRKICNENNVLLFADEVMSGWYRTGPCFAMDAWDIQPDIMTTAKGATAAYTPLGITAVSKKVGEFFDEEMFCHGQTYAYHALASAAVPAAISEYKKLMDSGLPQKVSKYLEQELYKLSDKHECIGDVRGVGHFWGLEIVKNRKTKEPFNTKPDKITGAPLMTAKIAGEAMANGVFLNPWIDTLVIAPPLIITEQEVDKAISVLDKALEIGDKEVESTSVAASRTSNFTKK